MLKLITPPPIEPISAADARIQARIEHERRATDPVAAYNRPKK